MTPAGDKNRRPIAFFGGRLIDGRGGRAIECAVVVVENQKIRMVGSSAKVPLPQTAKQIDITGKTIMPGLIDAHVHVGNIAVFHDKTASYPPAVYVHLATRHLENDIDLGFTTLRDAGGMDWGFRDAIDRGLINGPRLLLSVSPLTPTGGHFDDRGPMIEPPLPRNSIGIFPEICDGPDAVRKAAREVLRKGADHVKVAADGGVTSPTDQPGHWQFTVEEMRAAVETAEAAGTYVMAHAYSPKAIQHCIEAGVRSIEHGNLLDMETAEMMAKAGTYYVPTMAVYDILANEGSRELDPATREKLEAVRQSTQTAVDNAQRAGVKIGSGSDIIGPYQHLKGRELRLKAEVMSPMAAITSATCTNAEMLGLQDSLGTLEEGKTADLLIVNGDPVSDLRILENNTNDILLVMKAGEIVKDRLGLITHASG
jgi:imidazolonepropionase-like amidohydrolase